MRIIDWSSDVCSSDLDEIALAELLADRFHHRARADHLGRVDRHARRDDVGEFGVRTLEAVGRDVREIVRDRRHFGLRGLEARSEEHTSELQSLMRISYDVFCLTKKQTYTLQRVCAQH